MQQISKMMGNNHNNKERNDSCVFVKRFETPRLGSLIRETRCYRQTFLVHFTRDMWSDPCFVLPVLRKSCDKPWPMFWAVQWAGLV